MVRGGWRAVVHRVSLLEVWACGFSVDVLRLTFSSGIAVHGYVTGYNTVVGLQFTDT